MTRHFIRRGADLVAFAEVGDHQLGFARAGGSFAQSFLRSVARYHRTRLVSFGTKRLQVIIIHDADPDDKNA